MREHGDMAGIAGERHPPRAAAEPAVGAERDMAVGVDRGEGQRPARRRDAGARQHPAGHQGLRQRRRDGEAAGRTQYRKAVGHRRAAAAEILRDPGDGQPRLFERIPQRRGPHTAFGVIDRGGLAQILKYAGRGIDDDVVGIVAHPDTRF
jgi:hypothetical protein